MNWTTEHSTTESDYWLRCDNEDKQPWIAFVINAERMVALGSDIEHHLAGQSGVWYGPLGPPPFEERESQP